MESGESVGDSLCAQHGGRHVGGGLSGGGALDPGKIMMA